MKACKTLCLVAAAGLIGAAGPAQADEDVFRDIPSRNPQQLQELANLSDSEFRNAISNDWDRVRAILDAYLPPQAVPATLPRSFAGPRNACLRDRSPKACRVYISDLITIQLDKAQSAGALLSPFSVAN